MATTMQNVNISDIASFLPGSTRPGADRSAFRRETENRVYALAFWMTDHEIAAEELTRRIMSRAVCSIDALNAEAVDRELICQLRESMPLGRLTLQCDASREVVSVRKNTLRVHLERAVVQLPATERMIYLMHDGEGYSHARIARSIGITETDSQSGLHQARLRIRELLASMS